MSERTAYSPPCGREWRTFRVRTEDCTARNLGVPQACVLASVRLPASQGNGWSASSPGGSSVRTPNPSIHAGFSDRTSEWPREGSEGPANPHVFAGGVSTGVCTASHESHVSHRRPWCVRAHGLPCEETRRVSQSLEPQAAAQCRSAMKCRLPARLSL